MNEKIDLSKFLTVEEAANEIGCSRRSLYRALDRIDADVSIELFGRRLFRKDKIHELKAAYFPHGSAARHEMAQIWGSAGGLKKASNAKKRARSAKRAGT